jgi:hypothetical protein
MQSEQERLGQHYNRYQRINTDEYNKNHYTSNDFKTVFSDNFNLDNNGLILSLT